MIRLLAIDMDGTCLDRRSRVTDRTMKALSAARDKGVIIVPTTGRSLSCIPHRLAEGTIRNKGDAGEKKGLFRYVITSNGAQVTDVKENRDIFQKMIPKKQALSLLEACRGIRLGIISHINHEYLLQGKLLLLVGHLVYGKDASGARWVRSMSDAIRRSPYGTEEIQFYFLSGAARKRVELVLHDFPELSAAYTSIYVEIFSKGTSKGTALRALQEYLGVGREETACIGDGENDISMFRSSGVKIAMGNAVPELREAADYTVETNGREGVAEAIEKYIL